MIYKKYLFLFEYVYIKHLYQCITYLNVIEFYFLYWNKNAFHLFFGYNLLVMMKSLMSLKSLYLN